MRPQIENREQYRLVAVQSDGTEMVLISDLSMHRAESIRAGLGDSIAVTDIRIEPTAENRHDDH